MIGYKTVNNRMERLEGLFSFGKEIREEYY